MICLGARCVGGWVRRHSLGGGACMAAGRVAMNTKGWFLSVGGPDTLISRGARCVGGWVRHSLGGPSLPFFLSLARRARNLLSLVGGWVRRHSLDGGACMAVARLGMITSFSRGWNSSMAAGRGGINTKGWFLSVGESDTMISLGARCVGWVGQTQPRRAHNLCDASVGVHAWRQAVLLCLQVSLVGAIVAWRQAGAVFTQVSLAVGCMRLTTWWFVQTQPRWGCTHGGRPCWYHYNFLSRPCWYQHSRLHRPYGY